MRFCLCLLAIAAYLSAADLQPGQPLRGKLSVRDGKPSTITTSDRMTYVLDGDDNSMKIVADKRLDGSEVEARGHFTSPGHFQLDAMHTHSMLVRKDGKLKLVTYWCDVCNIRAFTPGPCPCCQKEMLLELQDPDAHEHDQ